MYLYKIKNLNVRCGNEDFLVSGVGYFVVDELDDNSKEATFEKVELFEIISKDGVVTSNEVRGYIEDATIIALNKNYSLLLSLAHKV